MMGIVIIVVGVLCILGGLAGGSDVAFCGGVLMIAAGWACCQLALILDAIRKAAGQEPPLAFGLGLRRREIAEAAEILKRRARGNEPARPVALGDDGQPTGVRPVRSRTKP